MTAALAMFLAFIAVTLGVTWWAAGRSRGESAYFAANRRITAWQNGVAVAGDSCIMVATQFRHGRPRQRRRRAVRTGQ